MRLRAHNTQEKPCLTRIKALEHLADSDRQPAYRTVWDTYPDRSTVLFGDVPGNPFDGLTVATWC